MSGAPGEDFQARMQARLRPQRLKRFYKAADYAAQDGGFVIRLDGRAVRTPARAVLLVPSGRLASAIAAEWDAQGEVVEPASMPLTRMASTALDLVTPSPQIAISEIHGYGLTDVLLFRADQPDGLVAAQLRLHAPVLAMVRELLGVDFAVSHGVQPAAQSREALESLRTWLQRCGPFTLAGVHTLTTLSGSVLMAVCVCDGILDPEAAWTAAHVEEDWNIARWGEDEEAAQRRQVRWREFAAAALFCHSIRPEQWK